MQTQNKTKNLSLTLLLLAMLVLAPAATAVGASLSTDKEDYEPGDMVTYAGSGFTAGEEVNLLAEGSTNGTLISIRTTAGENGDISGSFNLPLMYEEVYTLTAAGASSGLEVSTTFLDAVTAFQLEPAAPVSLYPGGTQVYTASAKTTGNNPVQGVAVDWTTTDPYGTMTPTDGNTGADGKTSSTYTAGSTPGAYRVTATAPVAGKDAFKNVTILPPVIPGDTNAPTTTIELSGTEGNNDWFVSDVGVTLTATDDGGSGVKEIHYILNGGTETTVFAATATFSITTEGIHTLEYWAVDNAGNVEDTNTATIKIDKTAPTINGSRNPAANSYGWNNTDVTVHFTASDDISGIDTVTPDTILSGEGAGQFVTGTAFDMAGNSASTTVSDINIDKTAPEVTITVPDVNAVYLLNQNILADWSATDALSGIASSSGTVPSGSPIPTGTVGAKTFIVTATDEADNTTTKAVNYYVRYNFIGFLPPVDNPSVINVGKAGRTFPIKWQLKDANGNFISDLGVVLYNPLRYRQTASGSAIWGDLLPGDTSGESGLRYDSTSNQYIFTWQTSKAFANKSYELLLELNDGSVHNALFSFTK
jgi:hypothetical protein